MAVKFNIGSGSTKNIEFSDKDGEESNKLDAPSVSESFNIQNLTTWWP